MYLRKAKGNRSETETKELLKVFPTKLMEYLTELDADEDTTIRILQRMDYEFYKEGSTVFKYGDYGDKFYIIIEGTVGVYIP